MTTLFITRHPGAIEWATRRGFHIDRQLAHLDPADIRPGDTVIGTLPVNLAAEVCARGARIFNLSLDLPAEARGKELSAHDLERYGARLEEYLVMRIKEDKTVLLEPGDNEARLSAESQPMRTAQELVRKHVPEGVSLVDELIAERRAEAERE